MGNRVPLRSVLHFVASRTGPVERARVFEFMLRCCRDAVLVGPVKGAVAKGGMLGQ